MACVASHGSVALGPAVTGALVRLTAGAACHWIAGPALGFRTLLNAIGVGLFLSGRG